jgi:large subunit ribosomal protein L7Ae
MGSKRKAGTKKSAPIKGGFDLKPTTEKKGGKAGAKPAVKVTLFEKNTKRFGIGQDLAPRKIRDLSRFVKWPQYIRIQRQRRVLYTRLKVPPMIHQFTNTLDLNLATELFSLADKYRPENKDAKKKRLLEQAKNQVKGKKAEIPKPPIVIKYGINHITALVEQKKAALVVIAHDVDPVELVIWLPTLCQKKGVPWCIVKSKARLGQLVHKKTATAVCFTNVNQEHKAQFATLLQGIKANFTDKYDALRKKWGGQVMGAKHANRVAKHEKAVQAELLARAAHA